jgi:glycerol uptake facilitator-like aquaporin
VSATAGAVKAIRRCPRQLAAEAVGTALLLAAVVGSGIMGERLAGGSQGLALLANTLATGAALVALISIFGPISGAHFNPAVTLALAVRGAVPWALVPAYLAVQLVGALLGVALAHLMFDLPILQTSTHTRSGVGQWAGELVATFTLLSAVWGCGRRPAAPYVIACVIMAGYWSTSSTSFANPAVTIARALTDTFTGIAPQDVPGFLAAQLLGAATATSLFAWLGRAGRPK